MNKHTKAQKLTVNGAQITLLKVGEADNISLTDMVRSFGDNAITYSWMRNRNTLEFIGLWEQRHNPGFKGNEFVTSKMQAGLNSFNLMLNCHDSDEITACKQKPAAYSL